jgi:hypothetical protein
MMLNKLVAKFVMGLKIDHHYNMIFDGKLFHEIEPYSESIEAAWEVVEKGKEYGLYISLHNSEVGTHRAEIFSTEIMNDVTFVVRDTAPEAICLGYLLAVLGGE